MQKNKNSGMIFLAFLLSSGFYFSSCGVEPFVSPIPQTSVLEQINLNDLRYRNLRFVGGYAYFPDAGFKGLVMYRESNNVYRVFDRACPYDPLAECAIVEVDSSTLFMIDRCCNSQFNFSGMPIGGPATAPMREYRTRIEGNFLIVTSE
ncbi:MAG: hypothetical protein ACFCUU_14330 [Cyclobacteriaceae bacterium]